MLDTVHIYQITIPYHQQQVRVQTLAVVSLSFLLLICMIKNQGQYRRRDFVLRYVAPLSPHANKSLNSALVRTLLETNKVICSPHEDKHILMLEHVQKMPSLSLQNTYPYYQYMYLATFIQEILGYHSLATRKMFF